MPTPMFDTLETRTFLSAAPLGDAAADRTMAPAKKTPPVYKTVTCTMKKGVLTIYGTAKADEIRTTGSKGKLYVQVKNSKKKFTAVFATGLSSVKRIVAHTASGDDKLTLRDIGYYTTQCQVDLGQGNDFYQGSDVADVVTCGTGNDEAQGFEGNDELTGGDGSDKLFGNDGNDTMSGGADNDTLVGSGGDDLILAKDGNYTDHVSGGGGNDTALADKQVFGGIDYWETDNIFAEIEHYS